MKWICVTILTLFLYIPYTEIVYRSISCHNGNIIRREIHQVDHRRSMQFKWYIFQNGKLVVSGTTTSRAEARTLLRNETKILTNRR
jgi:hypothetical protein